ncbi:MAG: hypothetical protein LBI48_12950 [Burkholderiaceae bacterium]|jgi:hypothetical protein|nr:hypothetical protein [Burkholderiaceae bacterium]
MQVISRSSFFCRMYPPVVVGFGVLAVIFAASAPGVDQTFPPAWTGGLAIALVFLVMFFAMPKTNLADEVRDAGDALIVHQSGEEVRIPLADIANVDTRPYPMVQGLYYTTLTLRAPCHFGDEVGFLPIRERKFFSLNSSWSSQPPVIKDLIQRIDQARRRAI